MRTIKDIAASAGYSYAHTAKVVKFSGILPTAKRGNTRYYDADAEKRILYALKSSQREKAHREKCWEYINSVTDNKEYWDIKRWRVEKKIDRHILRAVRRRKGKEYSYHPGSICGSGSAEANGVHRANNMRLEVLDEIGYCTEELVVKMRAALGVGEAGRSELPKNIRMLPKHERGIIYTRLVNEGKIPGFPERYYRAAVILWRFCKSTVMVRFWSK